MPMKTLAQRETEIEEAELLPFRLAGKLEADIRSYCESKHLPIAVRSDLNEVSITVPNNTTVVVKALGSKVSGAGSPTWWEIDNTEVTEDQIPRFGYPAPQHSGDRRLCRHAAT